MCKNDDKKVLNKYAGGVNGEKVYTQKRDVMGKQISAAKFLAIFDEPMLDEKRFLLFGNKTLDDLMFLSCKSKEEITSFKGIGDEIADAYINFFNKNIEEIIALRQYFTFESVYDTIEENNGGGKKMSMPTICFTGACPGFTRKELTEKCQGKYDVKDCRGRPSVKDTEKFSQQKTWIIWLVPIQIRVLLNCRKQQRMEQKLFLIQNYCNRFKERVWE